MLGVLKRRWKPKRAANGNRLSMDAIPVDLEKPRVSVKVHPCEDKHMLAYDQLTIDTSPNPPSYPLAPNICVEGGRIEFIKLSPDSEKIPPSTPLNTLNSLPNGVNLNSSDTLAHRGKVTVNRGLQTDDFQDEKEILEARIAELEEALEDAKRTEIKDKQTLTKLQKQLQRRESDRRDVEREKRLRTEGEARLREATAEAQRCRHRLKILTHEFQRMEETVRAMLVYKSRAEQLKQEKSALTVAFESRTQSYQSTIQRLNNEIVSLRQQLDVVNDGLTTPSEGRMAALEADNMVLCRDAEATRRQYEKCLDDVANQVVRALMAQKNLREEISTLTKRIKDLETQNRALTTLLVHQLRESSSSENFESSKSQLALECSPTDSLPNLSSQSLNIKHCNSFNSEQLNEIKNSPSQNSNRISTTSDILEAGFSFEDKKRHQILTKLWTDLKGSELTPQKLIDALSNVDSALFVAPQRPMSLNLQLPILQNLKCRRTRPILAQSSSKSEEETGNESPESGNRDEGYSTMSSDVQEVTNRLTDAPPCGLEDLKEATDETDLADTRIIVMEDSCDPDILYIPLSFAFGLNPRNSYPPSKNFLPFQHIMRSFSDSHLCLKITTAPSPCYSINSPISSSPSILFLDISERVINPLRRTKGTSFLPFEYENFDNLDEKEYVQHWLKIDETRNNVQEYSKDMLELEYDRAELEDWSLNLSSEDITNWRKSNEILTPGQISLQTLPSIQENNTLELEEDSNEDLWNNSSYLMDKNGGEIVALLMDTPMGQKFDKRWPYNTPNLNSCDSWSSQETNSEDFLVEQEAFSKRSSAALSDDINEIYAIGTDFTRDFYRLVKFESTKSLTSISSKSDKQKAPNGSIDAEKEQNLQNVLTFIAETQILSQNSNPEIMPAVSPVTVRNSTNLINGGLQEQRDFNIESPCENPEALNFSKTLLNPNFNETTENCDTNLKIITPNEISVTNCQNKSENVLKSDKTDKNLQSESLNGSSSTSTMSESQTSVSTSETIVSRIPRRTSTPIKSSPKKNSPQKHPIKTKIPSNIHRSPKKSPPNQKLLTKNNLTSNNFDSKIDVSKIQNISPKKSCLRPKSTQIPLQICGNTSHKEIINPLITSESLIQCQSGLLSNIIDGPPHRAVSFHERATSKDVIEELNRIIRKGDDNGSQEEILNQNHKLDTKSKATGWVHVEKCFDLSDVKVRANLDVMLTSSDSSPTSSCGGSISSESTDDPLDYGHLHRIHRYNRQKKASAVRPKNAVLRYPPSFRPCIIGRDDFYVRYGDKEKEAVASFDFLDEFSTGSLSSSIEEKEENHEEIDLSLSVGDSEKLL